MSEAVSVAREDTELHAQILRGRLEADGIEAWLRGARVASTVGPVNEFNTSWQNPLGGVEVMVRAEDAEAAVKILRQIRPASQRTLPRLPNWLRIMVGGLFAFSGWVLGDNLIHPLVGYLAAALVVFGTVVSLRK